MALEIGDTIDGKYEIVGLLGEGGMGAVYEGLNTRIHRRVAIKVLHAGVAGNDEAMKRFEREAQAAGRIGSEHIVEVLDLGDLPGGERYMVMEFLEGEPLSDRIARGRMTPREIATIVVDMLEGLEAAHQASIIHRDLKPDNIFLLKKGDFTKIVDFGISKFNAMGGEFSMTRTGAVMGTPYYMAPEQAKGGKDVDHRVDVYAVGVILYQAVVGEVPFEAATFNELLFKIVLEQPPRILDAVPDVDPAYVSIVEKAMAREPSERFDSASALQGALQAWLGGDYIPAGRTVAGGTPALQGGAATMLGGPGAPVGASMATPGAGVSPVADETFGVPTKKSPLGLILGGAAAALLIGGVAFALSSSGGSGQESSEELTPEDASAAPDEERTAALAALEEEKKKAEEARRAAEEARAAAEKDKAALEAQKAAAEQAKEGAAAPPAPKPRGVAPAPRPRPRPAAPRPATPRPAAPSPKPTTQSGGRPIRTDL